MKKSFNNEAANQVQIITNDYFRDVLDQLQGWGFKVMETGVTQIGASPEARLYANLELPAGWRKFGAFDPDQHMSYLDEKGALRLSVTNREAQGRLRESYGVSFYNRFSLSEMAEDTNIIYDKALVIDHKTGQEYPVSMSFSDVTDIGFTSAWDAALLDKFGNNFRFIPGNKTERGLALATLWDQDIAFGQADADDLRVRVLEKFYALKEAELKKKRGDLKPPSQ